MSKAKVAFASVAAAFAAMLSAQIVVNGFTAKSSSAYDFSPASSFKVPTTSNSTISLANSFTTAGNFPLTLTTTATTNTTMQSGTMQVVLDQRALATNSTNQSIANSTGTALTFDTNSYDTASIHSTVTNTSRFTAPATGNYLFVCQLTWPTNADVTNIRALSISVNGSSANNSQNTTNGSVVFQKSQNIALNLHMAATDYAECVAFQSSGGALNALAGTTYGQLYRVN